ncbi:MAG: M23 family metallopeptidase [Blautia sp.]|nr:M23 family metallopeptidase [Blautia sp.]
MREKSIREKRNSAEKFTGKNLRNIKTIVQRETGTAIASGRKLAGYQCRRMALLAGSLLCFVTLCAFGYAKFSDLNGDTAGFAPAYQGNGRFEIVIMNDSDKELNLQDRVKVMQWSTGKEVEGDSDRIRMSGLTIAPHSQGIVSIDISEGYDVEAMEENLGEKDGYYFVLTNNNFAFGQDWMCFFDFEIVETEEVRDRLTASMEQRAEAQAERERQLEETLYDTGELIYPDWIWPTVSQKISASYGERANGTYSDHVNIAGTAGDDVYAVADGTVTETGFEAEDGNVVVVDLGNGVTVKYGHLKEVQVSAGDEVKQGQAIGTLGRTGMATGSNLLFAVIVDGEGIDPLVD